MEQKFEEFNRLMFDDRLPKLPIVLSNAKSYLGACVYQKKKSLFGKTVIKQLPRVHQKIIAFCNALSKVAEIASFTLYVSDEPYFNRFPTSTALKIYFVEKDILSKQLDTAKELVIVGDKVVFRK